MQSWDDYFNWQYKREPFNEERNNLLNGKIIGKDWSTLNKDVINLSRSLKRNDLIADRIICYLSLVDSLKFTMMYSKLKSNLNASIKLKTRSVAIHEDNLQVSDFQTDFWWKSLRKSSRLIFSRQIWVIPNKTIFHIKIFSSFPQKLA